MQSIRPATEPPVRSARRVLGDFLAAQLVTGLGALAVNVLSARSLGPGGRGQVALFLQLGVTAGVVLLAGVDRSYPASVTSRPTLGGAVRDLRGLALPGIALTGGVAAAVAVVLLVLHRPEAPAVAATALVAVGSALGSAFRAAASVSGTSRPFLVATVAGQSALTIVGGAFLVISVTAPALWLTAYGLCLLGPFLIMGNRGRRIAAHPQDHLTARRIGWTLVPSTVAGMVMLRSDRFLLPVLAGYSALGVYGVVATFTELISLPVQAYVDSHIPAWQRAHHAGTLSRARVIAVAGVYAAVATVVGTVTIRAVVVPLFGSEYRAAIALVFPLAAAAALYAVSRVGIGLALACQRARSVAAVDVCAMAVAVLGYLLLIPHVGAMGAAWGSLAGYGTATVMALAVNLPRRPAAGGPRSR